VTPKPIADNDNPQELTPPTPVIDSNHEQFAEGDRVVIAEVGNAHQGKQVKSSLPVLAPKTTST
jgi:hypothetical protein